MKILITGSAGFIGYHLTEALLSRGDEVVALDNIDTYYDPKIKYARLAKLGLKEAVLTDGAPVMGKKGLRFWKGDLIDGSLLERVFGEDGPFDLVCHLAARAGVRHNLDHPMVYINSNIVGFLNVLECCRHGKIRHLVYASTSSIYGLNRSLPFSVSQKADHPSTLYAATKKSDELMAHVYSHLCGLPSTGLRLFSVYGPWGRPDMAYFLFTKAALEGRPIQVFNEGNIYRDFTYVDDVVEGFLKVISAPPPADGGPEAFKGQVGSNAPYRLYNMGRGMPVSLKDLIKILETALGMKIKKEFLPMQSEDLVATHADCSDFQRDFNHHPSTLLDDGVGRFVNWYREEYGQWMTV